MNKTAVIAVIGCGRIAKIAHFPAFAKMNNVRVKYACDLIVEKAEKIQQEYPILVEKAITDYQIALDDGEVDAVYVLTPNYAHYQITMDALEKGKHVFCEKPITVNYELSCRMAQKAEEMNKMLVIGVCNRFHKTVEMLEEMNRSGAFGTIYHVYCSFRSYRSIPGLGGAFTTKAESGGGVLIDWGVHFLDIILYILGDVKLKTVTCDTYCEMAKDMKNYHYLSMWASDTGNINGTNDVDDFVTGHIRTDKASISFNGAWAQNINAEEMYIDFMGDKGGARMNYGGNFTFYTDKDGTLQTVTPVYKARTHYEVEDENFIENIIAGGRHSKNSINKILQTAKLLDALYTSASEGMEIRL